MAQGEAEVRGCSRQLALVQRVGVSGGCLGPGLDEVVANGPPLWLHMLLDVPRGSFAVKPLARWLARSRMFGRRCSLPT